MTKATKPLHRLLIVLQISGIAFLLILLTLAMLVFVMGNTAIAQ